MNLMVQMKSLEPKVSRLHERMNETPKTRCERDERCGQLKINSGFRNVVNADQIARSINRLTLQSSSEADLCYSSSANRAQPLQHNERLTGPRLPRRLDEPRTAAAAAVALRAAEAARAAPAGGRDARGRRPPALAVQPLGRGGRGGRQCRRLQRQAAEHSIRQCNGRGAQGDQRRTRPGRLVLRRIAVPGGA